MRKTQTGFKSKLMDVTCMVGDAVIPKSYRKNISGYFEKASIEKVPYCSFGIAVYLILFLLIVFNIYFMSTRYFSNVNLMLKILYLIVFTPLLLLVFTIIASFAFRIFLDSKISYKTRQMENVFPEFLSELSLNLKAGLSLEKALDNSLEKEFGYLEEEIKKVSKKIKLGDDAEDAIREFSRNYESDMIQEAFDLILISWKKGVSIPPIIDRLVDNMGENLFLRKKVIASVGSYIIFLFVITVFITPALFSLAFYMVDLIRKIINQILSSAGNSTLPFAIFPVRVNDTHFILFASIAIIIISAASAIIISIVKTGSVKGSYKRVFLYPVLALIAFRAFMAIFGIFFGIFNI
jgi:pilus assembly protein TadC